MRNLKTTLAVILSITIARFVNTDTAFYAGIAAIIVMKDSIEASYATGKNRMIGTIIGAILGMLFACIKPSSLILCALGIIIIISLCNYFKLEESIIIAGIVFLAIMLNLKGRSPLFYTVNRVIETFIGIIMAVAVNCFLAPPKKKDLSN